MEVLTKLEADIRSIVEFKVRILFIPPNRELNLDNSTFQASTAQTQKKVVGHLVTYSIVIYLLVAIFAYFKLFPAARTTKVSKIVFIVS